MRNIDSFYLGLNEPVKSCLEALRTIILKHDSQISESMKYGMPFFSIHKKMLCYFWKEKKNGLPYIGFKEAKSLPFPWLEIGDRSTISVMYIDPYSDLPLKKLRQTLKAAIEIVELKSNQNSKSNLSSKSTKSSSSAKSPGSVKTSKATKSSKSTKTSQLTKAGK
ncbi:DUF1801 domain-containing protein [Flavitalea sp.]|nr:DUF1801 domain-containing protein [Flavitalea sp.]